MAARSNNFEEGQAHRFLQGTVSPAGQAAQHILAAQQPLGWHPCLQKNACTSAVPEAWAAKAPRALCLPCCRPLTSAGAPSTGPLRLRTALVPHQRQFQSVPLKHPTWHCRTTRSSCNPSYPSHQVLLQPIGMGFDVFTCAEDAMQCVVHAVKLGSKLPPQHSLRESLPGKGAVG